jgi:hypothetical protein
MPDFSQLFDPSDLSCEDPKTLFALLRLITQLRPLIEQNKFEEASAILHDCDPQVGMMLFSRVRTLWEALVGMITSFDALCQLFGINHYSDYVTLTSAVRPDLVRYAQNLSDRLREQIERETNHLLPGGGTSGGLSPEEERRVNDLLTRANLTFGDQPL